MQSRVDLPFRVDSPIFFGQTSAANPRNQWQVVTFKLLWVGEASSAGSQDGGANQSTDATGKMHNTWTREVLIAALNPSQTN